MQAKNSCYPPSGVSAAFDFWQSTVRLAINGMSLSQLNVPLLGSSKPLTCALKMRYEDLTNSLIAKGVNIDALDAGSDESALDVACDEGCTPEIARTLLEKTQRDLNAHTGQQGMSLLQRACASFDSNPMVQQLISANVDLEVMDRSLGRRALLIACEHPNVSSVKAPLDSGANPNAQRDDKSGTALHFAANQGSLACVKLLVEFNVDLDILNSAGDSALLSASTYNHWPIVNFLLQSGSRPLINAQGKHLLLTAASNGSVTTIQTLLRVSQDINLEMTHELDGQTALLLAAEKNLATVEVLVSAGSRIDAVSKYGNIVHHALLSEDHAMSLVILNYFLLQAVDWTGLGDSIFLNNQEEWEILTRATPLHHAAYRSDPRLLEFLLSRGKFDDANSQADPTEFLTPLHIAAMSGFHHDVEVLLRYGADPAVADHVRGWTPLHHAARHNNGEVVTQLLKHENCGIDIEDKEGHSPIVCASINGNQDIAKEIQQRMRHTATVKIEASVTPTTGPPEPSSLKVIETTAQAPSLESHDQFSALSPSFGRHWRIPLQGQAQLANAIAGNTTIYAVNKTACEENVLRLLENHSAPGVTCLDQHLKWQLSWTPAADATGSLDLMLPMEITAEN